MQRLPFADESVEFIFSWAAIEHVPAPELVMSEIERVLKPAGIALFAPAWNCRSWTVKRLKMRHYRDLSWGDRLDKVTIPIRNHLLWRGIQSLPSRVWRELRALLGKSIPFDYCRLQPDFNVNAVHVSDDDAFASMDPYAAIIYFRPRGWQVLSHPTFIKRFFSRHEPVVVRKPFKGK
jgi:SAM-dependent methyltransferase